MVTVHNKKITAYAVFTACFCCPLVAKTISPYKSIVAVVQIRKCYITTFDCLVDKGVQEVR